MSDIKYKEKLSGIRAFAMDVDGVLTDGGVFATPDGDLLRTFDSKDGFGLRMCKIKGYPVGIITGGSSKSVTKRALGLGIDEFNIYLHARDKVPSFIKFLEDNNLKAEEVAYAGDDIPDIGILSRCGLAFCPSDAVPEVKAVCDYVSIHKGGHGCVREMIEQVMKAKGEWNFDPELHSQWF